MPEPFLRGLFVRFLKERQYMQNASPETLRWYENAWKAWGLGEQVPTHEELQELVFTLRERGLCANSTNTHLRALNAFLHWLHLNKHTSEWEKVPIARVALPEIACLSESQVKWVLKYCPKSRSGQRAIAVVTLMLDCGIRRDEARQLRREDLLLDDLLVKVRNGKGGKFRTIPITAACRKAVWKWLTTHEHQAVFATKNGTLMSKRNLTRDVEMVLRMAGVTGVRCSPHTLRHTFATNYLRRGGDPLRLQRILGHSTLEMTKRYVNLQTADLSAVHEQLSAVGNGM